MPFNVDEKGSRIAGGLWTWIRRALSEYWTSQTPHSVPFIISSYHRRAGLARITLISVPSTVYWTLYVGQKYGGQLQGAHGPRCRGEVQEGGEVGGKVQEQQDHNRIVKGQFFWCIRVIYIYRYTLTWCLILSKRGHNAGVEKLSLCCTLNIYLLLQSWAWLGMQCMLWYTYKNNEKIKLC